SAEIYNPANGVWTPTNGLNAMRAQHTATLLPNGTVLIAGGYQTGWGSLSTTELYDSGVGTWTFTGGLNIARCYHTATLLRSGKVLVAGGYNGNYATNAEVYNPATGIWTT